MGDDEGGGATVSIIIFYSSIIDRFDMDNSVTADLLERANATLIKGHAIYCDQLKKNAMDTDIETYRDSVVKRFEYTFETAKKLINQQFVNHHKLNIIDDNKQLFRLAKQEKIIENEEDWIIFQEKRLQTLHNFNLTTALEAVDIIPMFLTNVTETLVRLRQLEANNI